MSLVGLLIVKNHNNTSKVDTNMPLGKKFLHMLLFKKKVWAQNFFFKMAEKNQIWTPNLMSYIEKKFIFDFLI